jgi:hypothetical protein
MVDFSDVLLLRPAHGGGFGRLPPRPAGSALSDAVIAVTVHALPAGEGDAFAEAFAAEAGPLLDAAGGTVLARLQTEPSANGFPALPVRENETVFVEVRRFADLAAAEGAAAVLSSLPLWREVEADLLRRSLAPPLTRLLRPTARSRLR